MQMLIEIKLEAGYSFYQITGRKGILMRATI